MPQRLARSFSDSSMSVLASTSMTTATVMAMFWVVGARPKAPKSSATLPPHSVNSEFTRTTPVSAMMAMPMRLDRS